MAKRRRRPARKKQAPGWVWMLFGLSIGLVVAFGVYIRGQQPNIAPLMAQPSTTATDTEAGEPASPTVTGQSAPDEPDATRFDFYELLPRFEVVVPEIETAVTQPTPLTAVDEPGVYVLQAGSFRRLDDADKRQASLALLGIESNVQVVTIGSDTFHRVRIGPMSDLNRLNGIRRRLIDAEIDTLLIRLPK